MSFKNYIIEFHRELPSTICNHLNPKSSPSPFSLLPSQSHSVSPRHIISLHFTKTPPHNPDPSILPLLLGPLRSRNSTQEIASRGRRSRRWILMDRSPNTVICWISIVIEIDTLAKGLGFGGWSLRVVG